MKFGLKFNQTAKILKVGLHEKKRPGFLPASLDDEIYPPSSRRFRSAKWPAFMGGRCPGYFAGKPLCQPHLDSEMKRRLCFIHDEAFLTACLNFGGAINVCHDG